MKNKRMFILLLTLAILSFSNWASAQPRVGDKISAFQLLDTGDNVRGINDGQGLVSVLLFVGYN